MAQDCYKTLTSKNIPAEHVRHCKRS